MNIDQNTLLKAAGLVVLLGVLLLGIMFVFPLLGIFAGIAVVGIGVFVGYLVKQGKFPLKKS